MAAAPASAPSSPHSDPRNSLAHAHLNDPNFDVDAQLRRTSSGSQRRRAAQLTALNTAAPSIRRRPIAIPSPTLSPPPSLSSPRSGFPLIPQHLPISPSLSRQPSYEPQIQPLHNNFAANPQPDAWAPSVSVPISSFISDPKPAFNSPISNRGHPTTIEDEYYDMESVAPSTSPPRFSTDTYPCEKRRESDDDLVDMEMDIRSEMDFEEYVFSSPFPRPPHPTLSHDLHH
jgi:hypothetical protein